MSPIVSQSRNNIIDAIKAFAIICVVFGHCIQYGSGAVFLNEYLFFDNPLYKIIYSFHMPLFMILSGFLFGFSVKKRKWNDVILQRAKTILIPILFWSLLPFIHSCLASYIHISSFPSLLFFIKTYWKVILTELWFLWAVFWCSLAVVVVRHFCKDHLLVYLVGLIITFVAPDVYNLHLYKFMYPYFVIGYLYCVKRPVFIKSLYDNNLTLPLLAILFIIFLLFYKTDTFIYISGYKVYRDGVLSAKHLMIDIYRFFTGFIGSLFFIVLFHRIYPLFSGFFNKALSYIGRNTLGIYIISGYLISFVLRYLTKNISGFNFFIALTECLGVLVISLIITELIKHTRHLKKLLLGIQ